MSDLDAEYYRDLAEEKEIVVEAQSATISSLRQQLSHSEMAADAEAKYANRLSQQLAESQAECTRLDAGWHAANVALLESQAREKVLRDALSALEDKTEFDWYSKESIAARDALTLPSDSTTLEQVKLAAKREALLDAASQFGKQPEVEILGYEVKDELRRMADNIN